MSYTASQGKRFLPGAAALFAVLLVAACGTSQEQNATGASGQETNDCSAQSEAQQQFSTSWTDAFQKLGLEPPPAPELTICSVNTSKWKKDPTNGKYRIAFAAQGPTNSWAVENEEAFKIHAQELGVEELYASADGDATKQVNNIQQLIAQSPDAMVVVPMGSGIVGQLQQAQQNGIPVVLCAGKLDNAGAVSTVVRSYDLQATLWVDWIAKQIHETGKIAMLSGIAGVPTAELQKAAAEEAFKKYPNIQIVTEQYTDWSPTKAKTVAASLVTQYPDLDAIWSDSAISDLGVVEAYKQAGKNVPPLTGDSSNAFLKGVQGTDVHFALSSFPPEQSQKCLDTAVDILKGTSVPSFVNVESAVYTDAELNTYIRPECTDNLWIPSSLPDSVLKQLNLC